MVGKTQKKLRALPEYSIEKQKHRKVFGIRWVLILHVFSIFFLSESKGWNSVGPRDVLCSLFVAQALKKKARSRASISTQFYSYASRVGNGNDRTRRPIALCRNALGKIAIHFSSSTSYAKFRNKETTALFLSLLVIL